MYYIHEAFVADGTVYALVTVKLADFFDGTVNLVAEQLYAQMLGWA